MLDIHILGVCGVLFDLMKARRARERGGEWNNNTSDGDDDGAASNGLYI